MDDDVMSDLTDGQTHHQTVQLLVELDLTGQATVVLNSQRTIQHHDLFFGPGSNLLNPIGVDITVTGGARTVAATVTDDARHHVVDRGLHDAIASFALDQMLFPVVQNKQNLRHERPISFQQ